ncbi:MAG: biopolymer transporter ExbD [bacterium]
MATHSDSSEDSGLITGINVTPLVDITLVLLIIFMVAAPVIMNRAIRVNLPRAASGKPGQATTVAITVKKDGAVYLNGRKTSRADLERTLRAKVSLSKNIRAIVSADRQTSHGTVVSYLDLLNRLGISRYAVSVERPASVVEAKVPQ